MFREHLRSSQVSLSRRTLERQGVRSCPPNPVFVNLLSNCWDVAQSPISRCADQRPRATSICFRAHPRSHTSPQKCLSLKRSPSGYEMACGCEVYFSFHMLNVANISLPFVLHECLLPQPSTWSDRHWWMSQIHVKTSQGRLDSWCQSLTVAWIQLGVVE